VSAFKVDGTDFYVVGLVPDDDLSAPSKDIQSRTTTFSWIASGVLTLIILISTVISFFVSKWFTMRVLSPVIELEKILEEITKSNLSVEVEQNTLINKEINMIQKHFRNLLVAVRFGNEAYYAGDLNIALENYLAAEQLMIQFKNERGHGICRNNIGNVYSQQELFMDAETAYIFAIKNAESLLSLETDKSVIPKWEILIAERKMNYGSICSHVKKYTQAIQLFEEALALFRKNDNITGIAQVCGNLGQMYIDKGSLDDAAELIDDSYEATKMAEDSHERDVALQYGIMNKGLLCVAQGKKEEALSWFL
ncbi:hypothetical protein HK096_000602, partial [Nowakowskiella sp. JEL0078]